MFVVSFSTERQLLNRLVKCVIFCLPSVPGTVAPYSNLCSSKYPWDDNEGGILDVASSMQSCVRTRGWFAIKQKQKLDLGNYVTMATAESWHCDGGWSHQHKPSDAWVGWRPLDQVAAGIVIVIIHTNADVAAITPHNISYQNIKLNRAENTINMCFEASLSLI